MRKDCRGFPMSLQMRAHIAEKIGVACVVLGFLALAAGCSELHTTVDAILGKQPPILLAQSTEPQTAVPGKVRMPPRPEPAAQEEKAKAQTEQQSPTAVKLPEAAPKTQAQPPAAPTPPEVVPQAQTQPPSAPKAPAAVTQAPTSPTTEEGQILALEGKRRAPGQPSPTAPPTGPAAEPPKTEFRADRDPFRPPSEVQVRTDYLPSTPLARFDYSQLKLVGIIQMSEGQIKGMVEDPDGRGYYVQPGMQIGDGPNMATVTQITNRSVVLRVHKTKQDVLIPLFSERAEMERM
ncbi:MAG: pilus assembly protein PilP [Desulfomonile sp.]|nr:pilus assembly protein PilP [Desulfomonile sp.]